MIKSGQSLFNPFFYKSPLRGGNNAWNNIKRKYLFNTLAAIVNGKRNTLAHKKPLGKLFLFVQIIGRLPRNIFNNLTVMLSHIVIGTIHFIPNAANGVVFVKIS